VGFEVYYRTHTCGELNASNVGQQVTLAGWVNRRRDHGGLVFLDIRDRYGITQVISDPEHAPEVHRIASELRSEYVVQISGKVVPRLAGTENPNLSSGAIEIAADDIIILNPSRTTPFPISDNIQVDESLRLKYRYLDLRRPSMRDNIILRHRVVKTIRDYLDERGFLEIETPILMKSYPEGVACPESTQLPVVLPGVQRGELAAENAAWHDGITEESASYSSYARTGSCVRS